MTPNFLPELEGWGLGRKKNQKICLVLGIFHLRCMLVIQVNWPSRQRISMLESCERSGPLL